MPAEGLLLGGVTASGALLWHRSANILAWTICAIMTTVGALAVTAKYTESKAQSALLPYRPVLTKIRSLASMGIKVFSWMCLGMALQDLIAPQLCWTFYYPSTTPKPTEMWLYTLRRMGSVILALSARLMSCPREGTLATAALGVLFSNWYHNNIGMNPPTFMSVTALTIGVYGLLARRSFMMSKPIARQRNMPIQSRVQ